MKNLIFTTLSLIVLISIISNQNCYAQEKIKANIETYEGNNIVGTCLMDNMKVKTKYGMLDIEVKDVLQINFGVHFPVGIEGKIDRAIKNLGAEAYKERILAQKELISLYRYSYFRVKELESKEAEVIQRRLSVLEAIKNDKDLKYVPAQQDDVLFLKGGSIIMGTIQQEVFPFKSDEFGDIKLKAHDVRMLKSVVEKNPIIIEGSRDEEWMDTGININGKLNIMARGWIDLNPNDDKKYYISTPVGLNNGMGALRARVGLKGKIIYTNLWVIDNNPELVGRLYLSVQPANWGIDPSGYYQVWVNK